MFLSSSTVGKNERVRASKEPQKKHEGSIRVPPELGGSTLNLFLNAIWQHTSKRARYELIADNVSSLYKESVRSMRITLVVLKLCIIYSHQCRWGCVCEQVAAPHTTVYRRMCITWSARASADTHMRSAADDSAKFPFVIVTYWRSFSGAVFFFCCNVVHFWISFF